MTIKKITPRTILNTGAFKLQDTTTFETKEFSSEEHYRDYEKDTEYINKLHQQLEEYHDWQYHKKQTIERLLNKINRMWQLILYFWRTR